MNLSHQQGVLFFSEISHLASNRGDVKPCLAETAKIAGSVYQFHYRSLKTFINH